jgi:hypothetical protein
VITGECRVDAIPPTDGQFAGHRLSIDGLRLRLDLRIVPQAVGADGCAAAVLRVENANVTTLPLLGLSVPLVYRRAAVLSSLAALAFALFVWFAGSPGGSADVSAPRAPAAAAVPPRVAPPAVSSPGSPQPAVTFPAGSRSSAAGSAPVTSTVQAPSAPPPSAPAPAAGVPSPVVTARPAPVALPARPAPAADPAQPVVTRASQPALGRPAAKRADSLDLFADTK